MTAPAAVLHDRRSPTPGTLARPLSEPITALLRDGDTSGRYLSRSEAVMATALAAASAGWTETAWRDVLAASALSDWAAQQRRKGGGLRYRNPADVDHRLTTTWKAAARRAAERSPVADAPSVRAELAALLAATDHNPALWAGAAGVTDRAVLAALVDIALAACTVTPSASTRQLSEAANISHSTAAVSLERLRTRGWLRLEQPAAGTHATTWRLVRPEHVQDPPAHVDEVLDALPPRSLTPAGGSTRAHDTFTHTVHGGLGRVAARLFDALDDGGQRMHDALDRGIARYLDAELGGSHDKNPVQIIVIVPAEALDELASQPGPQPAPLPARAGSGTALPRHLLRRWVCGSALSRHVLDLRGRVVLTSHPERTLKAHERRALHTQTGGHCQGAGCGRSSHDPGTVLHPHHADPWSRSGTTSLHDTVHLCDSCHHHLHDGRHPLRLKDGRRLGPDGWLE